MSFQCYYIGGLETSATGMLGEMSKPISWGMPALKVCEKLEKKDAQICDLKYGKFIEIHCCLIHYHYKLTSRFWTELTRVLVRI